MRFQKYLTEKKDHIIKRLKGLSKEEKDQLIPLFSSNNPKLEGMIDWNNKNLTFNDFKPVLDFRSKTSVKKGVKKQGIKGLKPNKDYIELKGVSKIYNAYIPLTYAASKFIASKRIGGCEGRWCTAYQKTKGYWTDYVEARGITLIYLIGDTTKYAIAMYPDANGMYEMFDADDLHITEIPGLNINKLNSSKMTKLYRDIQDKYFRKPSFVDKATVTDAEYEVKNNGNYVTWHDGRWVKGTWLDGEWHNGLWKDGVWEGGTWLDGFWVKGLWKIGNWENGNWQNGTWTYGVWNDGEWENGTWNNGIWNNGTWMNGTWKTGTWLNGTWTNGIWKKGTWNNGIWFDGIWKGGTWKGGRDKNGKFHTEGDSPDKWDDI